VAGLDDALQELYRASLADFVDQRKQAVAALRKAGDKEGAAALAARRRPTLSAWVVNQLWWHARPAFHALLQAAERMRHGDRDAAAAHRHAIATLRKQAASLLTDAGHAASEPTLRRVTTTLAALAANGGFDPDLPGTLAEDRDPPGFEAMAGVLAPAPARAPARPGPAKNANAKKKAAANDPESRRARMREEAAARAAEEAERRRREAERRRREAERQRIETRLRTARLDLERREERITALRKDLRLAEEAAARARTAVAELERALAAVGDEGD
jgi:hypothetical protein